MTYLTRTATRSDTPLGATSLYHTVLLSEAIFSGLSAKWQAYKTRTELRKLSNDQLADIGIERSQIAAVAVQTSR